MKIGEKISKEDRELIVTYLCKQGEYSKTTFRQATKKAWEATGTETAIGTVNTTLHGYSPFTQLTLPVMKELKKMAQKAKREFEKAQKVA